MLPDSGGGGYATELWLADTEIAGRQARRLAEVWNEIESDALAQIEGLEVEVDGATVVLRGAAASYPHKVAALAAARRVAGVQQVVDEIVVEIPADRRVSDDALTSAARRVLEQHALLPRQAITARAVDGWIDLAGEVERDAERTAAEDAVRALAGVRGVRNRITRRPGPADGELRERAQAAVRSRLGREGRHVKVSVRGDQLVLEGRVRSLAWWLAAERAAAGVPHAPAIANELVIEA